MAVALFGIAAGGGAVAGEQGARATLRALAPGARDLRVGWNGGLPAGVDARARRTLRSFTSTPQTRSTLLLATKASPGPVLQLAAIDPISRWVRLSSGRLPGRCTAARCEVVQLGGAPVSGPVARNGTRLDVVGRGVLTSSVPLGFVAHDDPPGTIAEARQNPLLVASQPGAVDGLQAFETVYRTQSWTAAFALGRRPSWQLGALRDRLEAAGNRLNAADDSYSFDALTDALDAASGRARAASRRVVLVGAGAAALLAAFAVLAAGALRRDLEAERARLRRRGARAWQLGVLTACEGLGPALVGAAAGAALAVGVTTLRAHAAHVPVGPLLTHALVNGRGLLALVLCWLVAGGLVALGARSWGPGAGRLVDVVALGAAGALALALARGAAGDGDAGDPLPTLLAPLALLVAGLLVARLAGPVLRGAEPALRRAPLPARLAGLGLARASGGPALTVAVVAIACGLACFAAAYAATLRHGERDEAAFAVPLDLTVAEGSAFVAPLQAAPLARWQALAGRGGGAYGVLRASGSVPRGATRATLPVLGVPPAALASMHGLRADATSAAPAELARRLDDAAARPLRGPLVQPGDRTVAVRARSDGDALVLNADFVGDDGALVSVGLGRAQPRARTYVRRLPAATVGRRLVALEAHEVFGLAATKGHNEAENPSTPGITKGTLHLSGVRLGGRDVDVGEWIGDGPLHDPRRGGSDVSVPFAFSGGGRALLRPRQATDGATLPVLADRETAASAARGGVLPLLVEGVPVRARVVGTLARFPTVGLRAAGEVVVDAQALATVLGASAPGSGRRSELWLRTGQAGEARVRAALRRPPLSALSLRSRRALEARLHDDPLSRELVRTLALAAVVALLLGVLSVVLSAASALRDDGAELYDLEAAGAAPATLRADVRLRALGVAVLGLLAGLAVGAALIALVVDAVALTATGRSAFPPLVTIVPGAAWAAGAGVFMLGCVVAVALVTRRAFSGPLPRRPPGVAP